MVNMLIICNMVSWCLIHLTLPASGNAPVSALPYITANPGQVVGVPIKVVNFNNIGAISLTIHYNASSLTYQAYTNSSGFPGLIAFSPTPGIIKISGFNSIPEGYSLSDGSTLVDMTFNFQDGCSDLFWYDNGGSCEYAGPAPAYEVLNDIPTLSYYINGHVCAPYQTLVGKISYHNALNNNLPLHGMIVNLKDQNHTTLATTNTDAAGNYQFISIPSGAARLEVVTQLGWGGVNATDALAIQKRTVGLPVEFWLPEPFIDHVADVNKSNTINSIDALLTMKRSVQLVTSFEAGDWAFHANEMNFTNTFPNAAWIPYSGETHIDILALCYGDVNGSYNPQTTYKAANIDILPDHRSENFTENMDIELIISGNNDVNALTLVLSFDPGEVMINTVSSDLSNLMYNVANGRLIICWSGLEPLQASSGSKVSELNIAFANNDHCPSHMFVTDLDLTEFAGIDCNVLDDVTLLFNGTTNSQSMDSKQGTSQLVSCFPNPFSDYLTIQYALNELASVEIEITSVDGKRAVLVSPGMKQRGDHFIRFDPLQYRFTPGILNLVFKAESAQQTLKNSTPVIWLGK